MHFLDVLSGLSTAPFQGPGISEDPFGVLRFYMTTYWLFPGNGTDGIWKIINLTQIGCCKMKMSFQRIIILPNANFYQYFITFKTYALVDIFGFIILYS